MSKKKYVAIIISSLLLSLSMIVIIIGGAIYYLFYDMEIISEDVLIGEYVSPTEEYKIKFYINESSLSAPAIKGVLYDDTDKKIKSIYNEYKQDKVNIEWIHDETVIINNHEIDILDEVYDWRRE